MQNMREERNESRRGCGFSRGVGGEGGGRRSAERNDTEAGGVCKVAELRKQRRVISRLDGRDRQKMLADEPTSPKNVQNHRDRLIMESRRQRVYLKRWKPDPDSPGLLHFVADSVITQAD